MISCCDILFFPALRATLSSIVTSLWRIANDVTIFHILIITSWLTTVVQGKFPIEKEPINQFSSQESGRYRVFLGTNSTDSKYQLLQDVNGIKKINSTFYVYSKNYIFVLDQLKTPVENEQNKTFFFNQEISWNVPEKERLECLDDTREERQCENHVTVLEQLRDSVTNQPTNQLLACGSWATYPKVRMFETTDNGNLVEVDDWKTSHSQYYCSAKVGDSTVSFSNHGMFYNGIEDKYYDVMFNRMTGSSTQAEMRSSRDAISSKPKFVKIFEGSEKSGKMLFFFNEFAEEEESKNQRLARVAQVCKNDDVFEANEEKRLFSTFFKAKLSCSIPGTPPFDFDLLESASDPVWLATNASEGKRVVFAAMRTPDTGLEASAICVFSIDEIEKALSGGMYENYKGFWMKPQKIAKLKENEVYLESDLAIAKKLKEKKGPDYSDFTSCNSYLKNGRKLLGNDAQKYAEEHPLSLEAVETLDIFSLVNGSTLSPLIGPVFTSKNDVFTTISIDDRDHRPLPYVIMLLGTRSGDVIKVLVLTSASSVVVVERRQVFDAELCRGGDKSVKSLQIDNEAGNLYVTYSQCVMAVPLCHVMTDCEKTCKLSRDPYCRWNGTSCVAAVPYLASNDQDLTGEANLTDCVVPVVPVKVSPPLPSTSDNKTSSVANTNASSVNPPAVKTVTDGDDVSVATAGGAGGDNWKLFIIVTFVGFFLGVMVTSIISCCCNPCHEIKKKRNQLVNGDVKSGLSRSNSNRHDPADMTSTMGRYRQKHPSESSTKSHLINNRISYYDDVAVVDGMTSSGQRIRTTSAGEASGSENNGGSGSRHNSSAKTPTTSENMALVVAMPPPTEDDKRKSRKLSTTSKSSTNARNINKVSVSSNGAADRRNDATNTATLNKNQQLDVNSDVFVRQTSNDSGHGNDHQQQQQEPLIKPHAELRRSTSVQQQPMHRTGSFGPGIPPKGRPIGRHNSFQVASIPVQDIHFTGTAPMMMQGNPREKWLPKTPVGPPPSMMVPINQSTKGMTYSLDRRKMPKRYPPQHPQADFQIAQKPKDPHGIMTPQPLPPRKRYVSETMTPIHPGHQTGTILSYPIIEDPMNPQQSSNPYPTGNRQRRNQLRLDLRSSVDPAMNGIRRMMSQQQGSPAGTPIHPNDARILGNQGFRKQQSQPLPSPMDRRSFGLPRQKTPVEEEDPVVDEDHTLTRKSSIKNMRTPSNPDLKNVIRRESDSTSSIPNMGDQESLNSYESDEITEYMETIA